LGGANRLLGGANRLLGGVNQLLGGAGWLLGGVNQLLGGAGWLVCIGMRVMLVRQYVFRIGHCILDAGRSVSGGDAIDAASRYHRR
jgi:hypothetical protein